MRELRKTKEKKSGDPSSAYTSCWPLFEALTLLQETVCHRRYAEYFIVIIYI